MYFCLFYLLTSLFLCQVSAKSNDPIERIIQDYFNSESVKKFRKQWETQRKPIENAIVTTLKDTVGLAGLNVYVRKMNEELASGYFHNDNQVRLILQDLVLEHMPRFSLSEVQFSLASNVIKIETILSKMIIHSNYALIRNKTDIIYEPKDQDPYKASPFLFQQVQDAGKVAISVEGCRLSGFMITTLTGISVNLGYQQFKIMNCLFTVEIYRPGEDSPPVIAKYNPYRNDEHGLGLMQLLMKPLIEEELVPKLQTALLSFVNTSSIFGNELQEFRENQEIVFQANAKYLTELVRNLNKITIEKNNGAIDMEDYIIHWDDGRVKPNNRTDSHKKSSGESLHLSEMVLTGLETLYSAHIGGPFKIDTVMMAEEIRFSSLQIRGKLEVKTIWSDTFAFSAEISDMAVDLQLGLSQSEKDSERANKNHEFKKLEVKGFRHMSFTVPSLVFSSAESMIGGYLLNIVPKLLQSHLTAIFSEALHSPKEKRPPALSDSDFAGSISTDIFSGEHFLSDADKEGEDVSISIGSYEFEDTISYGKRVRDTFKKNKKRFKSANRPRRRRRPRRSGKHVADNKIRKK